MSDADVRSVNQYVDSLDAGFVDPYDLLKSWHKANATFDLAKKKLVDELNEACNLVLPVDSIVDLDRKREFPWGTDNILNLRRKTRHIRVFSTPHVVFNSHLFAPRFDSPTPT